MNLFSGFSTRILWSGAGADLLADDFIDIVDPVNPVAPWHDLAIADGNTDPIVSVEERSGFRTISYTASGTWSELEKIEPLKLISIALIQVHKPIEYSTGSVRITGNLLPVSLGRGAVHVNDDSFTGHLNFRLHGNLGHTFEGWL
jgi:hypothetical protein